MTEVGAIRLQRCVVVIHRVLAVVVCGYGPVVVRRAGCSCTTPVDGDDNHVLGIGIGGGLGIVRMFNVWRSIWPNNKGIIRLAGSPPADGASLSGVSGLKNEFFLSVPLLFHMSATSHFASMVIFGK